LFGILPLAQELGQHNGKQMVCLTDEDASATYYVYNFMVERMGELVALDVAAEALRARHRELDKHAADEAVSLLIERTKAARA
jgi:hypothetical protein